MSEASEAVVVKRTVRRRRVVGTLTQASEAEPEPEPEPVPVLAPVPVQRECPRAEFLANMKTVFEGRIKDPESGRYSAEGITLAPGAPIELFHAFGVARDVLETSYRPLECNYSR
jgi:hypothetical protein